MTTISLGYLLLQLLLLSGIGFFLGRYFTEHIYPAKRPYPIIRVVMIISIMTALLLIRLSTLDIEPSLDQKLQHIPVYQTIKAQTPKYYANLLTYLEQTDRDGEHGIIQAQAILAPMVNQHLAKTTDEALWPYIRHVTKLIRTLQQYDAQACYTYAYPYAKMPLPDRHSLDILNQDAAQSEALLNDVLRQYNPQRPAPMPAEFEPAQQAIFARLSEKYDTDIELLDRADHGLTDPAEQAIACAMLIDIFTWLDERHDASAAATLRYLFDDTLP